MLKTNIIYFFLLIQFYVCQKIFHHDCNFCNQNFIKGKKNKLKWEMNLATSPRSFYFLISSSFLYPLPVPDPLPNLSNRQDWG